MMWFRFCWLCSGITWSRVQIGTKQVPCCAECARTVIMVATWRQR